ncbi:MAG: hypothetical protein GX142_08275 [Chloroflexi bacterium]|jgi:hypothetical protein|nr:hypothetical protein [Chloroflexota bacterium]
MKASPSVNQELLALERTLKSRFHPVKPDQQFVGNLRSRLENTPFSRKRQRLGYVYIITAGGLLIGLTIFLIGKGLFQGSEEA